MSIERAACHGYPAAVVGYPKSVILCPLYTKDDETADLVSRLDASRPLRERIAEWRKAHPLPPRTGLVADKAFFYELSGDL